MVVVNNRDYSRNNISISPFPLDKRGTYQILDRLRTCRKAALFTLFVESFENVFFDGNGDTRDVTHCACQFCWKTMRFIPVIRNG